MTREEFSDSFDTLLNSYASQAVFGEGANKQEIVLDEYEKSVMLSQAQDIIVKSYFDRSLNAAGQGFDDSSRRQIDFSSLITTATLSPAKDQRSKFDDRGILYVMPLRNIDEPSLTDVDNFDGTYDYTFHPEDANGKVVTTDVLYILNEKLISISNGVRKNYVVVPINYHEYDREMSKPYAQPLKKQAWRLFQNNSYGFDIKSELIPRWNLLSKESVVDYRIRYIRRPKPIILVDLPNSLYIDGYRTAQDCELNPILHPDILKKAVELVISTRGGRVSEAGASRE